MKILGPILYLMIACYGLTGQSCERISAYVDKVEKYNWNNNYLTSQFYIDSVMAKLDLVSLSNCQEVSMMRSLKGYAMMKSNKFDEAFEYQEALIKEFLSWEHYEALVNTYIQQALLYELLNNADNCRLMLDKARHIAYKYKITSQYCHLHVRYSSYYGVLGIDNDSSAHHALLAVNNAKNTNNLRDKSDAFYVLKVHSKNDKILYDSLNRQSMKYSTEANDYISNALSQINIYKRDFMVIEDRFKFLDSIKHAIIEKIPIENIETAVIKQWWYSSMAKVYESNKRYLEALNYKDSSSYFNNIKNELELASINAKLHTQPILIKLNADRENYRRLNRYLIAFGVISLLIIGGLAYLNLRLKKQKEEILSQKNIIQAISNNNEKLSKQNALLLSEVHHRVKNNLQNIISMLELRIGQDDTPGLDSMMSDLINKIHSISLIHQQLYENDTIQHIRLYDYFSQIAFLERYLSDNENESAIEVNVPQDLVVNIDTGTPLGLLVNELITNSQKHAQVADRLLINITVEYDKDTHRYTLGYTDNGQGFASYEPGMGTIIIDSMLRQLKAEYNIETVNGYKLSASFQEKNSHLS